MAFQDDMNYAKMKYQLELAAAATSAARLTAEIRYQRRRLLAENNNATSTGAYRALIALGVTPIVLDDATFGTDLIAVSAAVAVLVADGATPTQAHVNTANTAYTTLKGDLSVRTFVAADKTTFETALAQLVTDAGSPTQAHVNTMNTAWGTFLGGLS